MTPDSTHLHKMDKYMAYHYDLAWQLRLLVMKFDPCVPELASRPGVGRAERQQQLLDAGHQLSRQNVGAF